MGLDEPRARTLLSLRLVILRDCHTCQCQEDSNAPRFPHGRWGAHSNRLGVSISPSGSGVKPEVPRSASAELSGHLVLPSLLTIMPDMCSFSSWNRHIVSKIHQLIPMRDSVLRHKRAAAAGPVDALVRCLDLTPSCASLRI
jgi:hypothetical protein